MLRTDGRLSTRTFPTDAGATGIPPRAELHPGDKDRADSTRGPINTLYPSATAEDACALPETPLIVRNLISTSA